MRQQLFDWDKKMPFLAIFKPFFPLALHFPIDLAYPIS